MQVCRCAGVQVGEKEEASVEKCEMDGLDGLDGLDGGGGGGGGDASGCSFFGLRESKVPSKVGE